MTVTKHKDINWETYLRQLAESPSKPSDIEKIEFSGYLLRRDAELKIFPTILNNIFSRGNYEIADLIANFMVAESPDSIFDLLQSIKTLAVDHYADEIDALIKMEEREIEEERLESKRLDNPNDEYNNDEDRN